MTLLSFISIPTTINGNMKKIVINLVTNDIVVADHVIDNIIDIVNEKEETLLEDIASLPVAVSKEDMKSLIEKEIERMSLIDNKTEEDIEYIEYLNNQMKENQ